MINTMILIVLSVIALIVAVAFIVLSVRKSAATHPAAKNTSRDIRNKKIKCKRCGGRAFGVSGTGNIYRCRTCGAKTEGPTVEPRSA